MKRIVFNVFCSGVYRTELNVEDDFCGDDLDTMSDGEFYEILDYVRGHLHEANVGEIEWIDDIDVDADDIKYIESI